MAITNIVLATYVREELQCDRETDNLHGSYAVSVLKWRQIVGHVSCNISSVSIEPWDDQVYCNREPTLLLRLLSKDLVGQSRLKPQNFCPSKLFTIYGIYMC